LFGSLQLASSREFFTPLGAGKYFACGGAGMTKADAGAKRC
jgi:hypothetical protein